MNLSAFTRLSTFHWTIFAHPFRLTIKKTINIRLIMFYLDKSTNISLCAYFSEKLEPLNASLIS